MLRKASSDDVCSNANAANARSWIGRRNSDSVYSSGHQAERRLPAEAAIQEQLRGPSNASRLSNAAVAIGPQLGELGVALNSPTGRWVLNSTTFLLSKISDIFGHDTSNHLHIEQTQLDRVHQTLDSAGARVHGDEALTGKLIEVTRKLVELGVNSTEALAKSISGPYASQILEAIIDVADELNKVPERVNDSFDTDFDDPIVHSYSNLLLDLLHTLTESLRTHSTDSEALINEMTVKFIAFSINHFNDQDAKIIMGLMIEKFLPQAGDLSDEQRRVVLQALDRYMVSVSEHDMEFFSEVVTKVLGRLNSDQLETMMQRIMDKVEDRAATRLGLRFFFKCLRGVFIAPFSCFNPMNQVQNTNIVDQSRLSPQM